MSFFSLSARANLFTVIPSGTSTRSVIAASLLDAGRVSYIKKREAMIAESASAQRAV